MNDLGPPPRSAHTLVFDSIRQRTVCFGGLSNISDPGSAFGDTWEWEGQDWTQMAETGPAARSFHAMAYDSDRSRTVLFGGQVAGGFLNDTWEWDGTEWTQVADTGPSPRDACGATYYTSRQRVVLFGGETISQGMVSQVGETWEFGSGAWTQVATRAWAYCGGGACIQWHVDAPVQSEGWLNLDMGRKALDRTPRHWPRITSGRRDNL